MAKTQNQLSCPVVDLLTGEELHRALLRTVLVRHDVADPDAFVQDNSVESQVMYREVRLQDGTTTMMASVAITRITPVKLPAVDTPPRG